VYMIAGMAEVTDTACIVVIIIIIIIIIIIERRDFGGLMSKDCKDTLQTQNKTVRVRHSRTSKVYIRYRWRQSCRNQESFGRTVPSSADA